jgi:hypothetical protein
MLPGRPGRSLGERAANSGALQPGPPAGHGPIRGAYPTSGERAEGRHCWVRDPPDAPGVRPGLLVEWRQRDGAWQGRVAYTVAGPHGPALVESWLPAARLEPR